MSAARDDRGPWRLGLAGDLPLPGAASDRVVMSLLLRHLSPPTRDAALRQASRVLRPGWSTLELPAADG